MSIENIHHSRCDVLAGLAEADAFAAASLSQFSLTSRLVFLAVGTMVDLKAALTDVHLRYVEESLRPFLIAAAVLLLAAAAMTLYYELRSARIRKADAGEHGHGHAHHEPRVGWLLMLPALGLLLISPPTLGSYAAGQSGTALAAAPVDVKFSPLQPGERLERRACAYLVPPSGPRQTGKVDAAVAPTSTR